MTHQRRRGLQARVWKTVIQEDARGNKHKVADPTGPHLVKVWEFPQRSAKAEVPGQQHINVTRIGTSILEDVELWSRVEYRGKEWDVVAPPALHKGSSRVTRHYSIDIRERP